MNLEVKELEENSNQIANVLVIYPITDNHNIIELLSNIDNGNHTNFVIADPNGYLYDTYQEALGLNGYKVTTLNLSSPANSNHYNPLHYIHTKKDAMFLADSIIDSINPDYKNLEDIFWTQSEKMFISSLIMYLAEVVEPEKCTLTGLYKLLDLAAVNDDSLSAIDLIFDDLKRCMPNAESLQMYEKFKFGAGKTLKSIVISVVNKLKTLNMEEIYQNITKEDELNLKDFNTGKKVMFITLANSSINWLSNILYKQLIYEVTHNIDEY